MNSKVVYTVFKGSINRDLKTDYIFTIDTDPASKYRNVRVMPEHHTTYVRPNYSINISEGFEKPNVFVPNVHVPCVLDIIAKTLKAVTEHFKELYPTIGGSDCDIDPVALDTFSRDHAVAVNGYSALPCIYVTAEGECKPAIRLMSPKNESVKLPLADAIVLSKKLEKFDPDMFSMMVLFNTKASGI